MTNLPGEEEVLRRSCLLANQDADARSIEDEFDRIQDPIDEPWDEALAR
jgi:hypothetical protein